MWGQQAARHEHVTQGWTARGDDLKFRIVAPGLAESLPLLISVLAAIGALRMVALAFNGTDLFTDESQYWAWSREPAFGYYSKPPLIAWLIAATTPLCGDGEVCIRLPSVVIHLATSLVIYVIGLRLFSDRVGFWSAVAFATLPGISVSSGIISTDVPLLLAWAVALLAFAELLRKPTYAPAVLLGLALGTGLNAKYAMAYFVPCAAIYLVLAPESRGLLARPHLWIALAIGALLIAPNLAWNATHGFATLAHTADNANWTGSLVNPGKMLEFLVVQLGVFGPIMLGALVVILGRAAASRLSLSEPERLLAAFSVPVILAVTAQAFLSRSLANWAAPAYVAATLLVVSVMLRSGDWTWLRRSLILNCVIAVAIALATWQAGRFTLPGGDPFARTLGNRELASLVRTAIQDNEARDIRYRAILTEDRDIAAALLYYGRDIPLPLYVWRGEGRPRNHFEMTRPYAPSSEGPVLLLSRRPDGSGIPDHFATALTLGPLHIPAGDHSERFVHAFELSQFHRK